MNPKLQQTEAGTFWGELRRRGVVRAGGMYVAAAFVVLQLGEIVLPAFNAPDWVLQSLVIFVFLGTAGGPGVFVGLRPHGGGSHANGRVGAAGKGDGGPPACARGRHRGFRSARCSLVRHEGV